MIRFAFGLVDPVQLAPGHTISEYVLLFTDGAKRVNELQEKILMAGRLRQASRTMQ